VPANCAAIDAHTVVADTENSLKGTIIVSNCDIQSLTKSTAALSQTLAHAIQAKTTNANSQVQVDTIRQLSDGTLALDYRCTAVSDTETAKMALNNAVQTDDFKNAIAVTTIVVASEAGETSQQNRNRPDALRPAFRAPKQGGSASAENTHKHPADKEAKHGEGKRDGSHEKRPAEKEAKHVEAKPNRCHKKRPVEKEAKHGEGKRNGSHKKRPADKEPKHVEAKPNRCHKKRPVEKEAKHGEGKRDGSHKKRPADKEPKHGEGKRDGSHEKRPAEKEPKDGEVTFVVGGPNGESTKAATPTGAGINAATPTAAATDAATPTGATTKSGSGGSAVKSSGELRERS
ncbi:unnamed protein product, partial [Rotaria socialis]